MGLGGVPAREGDTYQGVYLRRGAPAWGCTCWGCTCLGVGGVPAQGCTCPGGTCLGVCGRYPLGAGTSPGKQPGNNQKHNLCNFVADGKNLRFGSIQECNCLFSKMNLVKNPSVNLHQCTFTMYRPKVYKHKSMVKSALKGEGCTSSSIHSIARF